MEILKIWTKENRMVTCTVPDLIPILKVKKRAVRRFLAEGRLKGRMIGHQWVVSENALRQFLESPERHSDKRDSTF
jgi:hypothetical protein